MKTPGDQQQELGSSGSQQLAHLLSAVCGEFCFMRCVVNAGFINILCCLIVNVRLSQSTTFGARGDSELRPRNSIVPCFLSGRILYTGVLPTRRLSLGLSLTAAELSANIVSYPSIEQNHQVMTVAISAP